MNIQDIHEGDVLLWHHEMRGGYGYVDRVPVRVVAVLPKRVRVAVPTTAGTLVYRTVRPESLHPDPRHVRFE